MPVRKVPKNYRNVTGIAASGKSIGAAQFESTLERDFVALLEFSPDVARFEVQPVKIEWSDGKGIARSYTPDVWIEFKPETGQVPWLCEVKYRADLKKHWDTLHPKFLQGIRYAKQQQWRFRLISEVEVRTPLLENVRFLGAFKFRNFPEIETAQLLGKLRELSATTPDDLLRALSSNAAKQAEWMPVLWHLIAVHLVGTDLEKKLTMASPIWSVS